MKNIEEYEAKLKLMPELDFDIALEVIWKKVKKELEDREWTQEQIGDLLGKERSNLCTTLKSKPDMVFTCLIKFTMAFDWNLDEVYQEIKQEILKAPRKLK